MTIEIKHMHQDHLNVKDLLLEVGKKSRAILTAQSQTTFPKRSHQIVKHEETS